MNIIWSALMILSIVLVAVTSPSNTLAVLTSSTSKTLETSATLLAGNVLWMGIFAVAEKCLLVEKLSQVSQPLFKKLYGTTDNEALGYISLNNVSNLLGIGNASTPCGIKAIERCEKTETLSRTGAMLFVINASGLQILPTTVMSLRATNGSNEPSSIVLPTIIATFVTAVVGIVLVNLFYPNKK